MEDGLYARSIRVTRGNRERRVPMTQRLFDAVLAMAKAVAADVSAPLIMSDRLDGASRPMRPDSIAYRLYLLFEAAGLPGTGSLAGRRTFIRRLMRAAVTVAGPTLDDVRQLAGLGRIDDLRRHSDAQPMTFRQRQLVDAIDQASQPEDT